MTNGKQNRPWRSVLDRLTRFLRQSPHFHVRQARFETLKEAIAVVDRFLECRMNYDLEWDDFISWENGNPTVEAMRIELADLEYGFLRGGQNGAKQATARAVEIRNHHAALIGLAPLQVESFQNVRGG